MNTTLKWDQIEERVYERGLDRVVIYLDDGTAHPWNGVVSLDESSTVSTSATYYEGNRVNILTETDSYSATINAMTYPDIVTMLEGQEQINNGIYLANQHPRPFSMSYRTGVGSATEGFLSEYKIHIIFGVVITSQGRARNTINADPEVDEFSWDITTVPPEVGDYRPTAQITLEESRIPEIFMEELHNALYGDGVNPPTFGGVDDLIDKILAYSRWQYIDNGDGTFDASPVDSSDLTQIDPDAVDPDEDYELYEFEGVEIEVIDDDTYLLLNGYGVQDDCSPRIVGSIGGAPETPGSGGILHLVRSALSADQKAHYIGTAPFGSQDIQPVWKVTKIYFGPPVTTVTNRNVRWTERES